MKNIRDTIRATIQLKDVELGETFICRDTIFIRTRLDKTGLPIVRCRPVVLGYSVENNIVQSFSPSVSVEVSVE